VSRKLRRRSLLTAAAALATTAAGCSSNSDDETTTATTTEAQSGSSTESTTARSEPALDVEASLPVEQVRAGESLTIEATATNTGAGGETELSVRLGADTVFTRQVELAGGESATLSLELPPIDRYGQVGVTVGDTFVGTLDVTHPPELHVAPDGSDDDPGTEPAPIATVQEGVNRARPGERVRVHPGEYRGPVITQRSGTADEPIRITGPADAVLKPNPDNWRGVVDIHHSHVHLEGLTIDGLLNPDAPREAASYVDKSLVLVSPPPRSGQFEKSDDYLTDVKVKPDRIGNTQRNMIIVWRSETVEIGEFEVIGPAGASWVFNDETDHVGEIVYLGQAPANIVGEDFDWYPWDRYDETRDVHVHHIDNSAGHPHSELVDCKLGTHDVTIEYCTDAGGSQNNETYTPSTVSLRGHDATVRWNRLADGTGHGIEIRDRRGYNGPRIEGEPQELADRAGRNNDIYGNSITGFDGEAITLTEWVDGDPFEQGHVCGNEIDGETDFDPEKSCSGDVPDGDGVGHTGGDSPWG